METDVLKSADQSDTGVGMAGVSLKTCDWPEERSDRRPNVVHLVVFSRSSSQEEGGSH